MAYRFDSGPGHQRTVLTRITENRNPHISLVRRVFSCLALSHDVALHLIGIPSLLTVSTIHQMLDTVKQENMALTDTFVRSIKPSGKVTGDKYTDGDGMYLLVKQVGNDTGKYWRMDYRIDGKRKTMALGVYPEVSLLKARKRRDSARELVADGIDPMEAKRQDKQAKLDAAAHTFEAVAEAWLAKTATKRAASTQTKNKNWLQRNVYPSIGPTPIASITARQVLGALQKIEDRGAIESAHKIKQLCGQIFRFAVANGLVEHDVTANLRGALSSIPKGHYAAITEPQKVGMLLRAIYGYGGHPFAAAALRLAPLVFVRPGELRAAEWSEISLDAAEWRIPAAKMKMKADHLVPLSDQAVAILRKMEVLTGHERFVFPSIRSGTRCMSENTVNAALRGLGYSKDEMTAHGFRAMARTIMDEVLGERVDLIEHQLAHAVRDANGTAYNRTAHLPARRMMMQRWADYLDTLRTGGDIRPLMAA